MESTKIAGLEHLAPPGAGLPTLELFFVRGLFGFIRWRGSKESYTAHFQRERAAVHRLVDGCDDAAGDRRVLIRRLPGMEDSSRSWSVWMTLDHLRIIHVAFAQIIGALARGVVPAGQASTAAVKPSPDATRDVVAAYEASCDALLSVVTAVPDLKTAARYPHPWFGPLDAAGWYALAGTHLGIHRKQIELILADGRRAQS